MSSAPLSGPSVGPVEKGERRPWWKVEPPWIVRDVLLAGLVVLVGFLLDSRSADRGEVLENTRFVRQVAIDHSAIKPFSGLRLEGSSLGGLDLGCRGVGPKVLNPEGVHGECRPGSQADFSNADLRRTDFSGAVLFGADFRGADLRDAVLDSALLNGANFFDADLRGTRFGNADLRGAYLQGAKMDSRGYSGVCSDRSTSWPKGLSHPGPRLCYDE
jgi:hypothetical protein